MPSFWNPFRGTMDNDTKQRAEALTEIVRDLAPTVKTPRSRNPVVRARENQTRKGNESASVSSWEG
jgi:hypothetical protein